MSFDTALQFVLGFEGGYSNHPRDPGGSTNLGVTQVTLDAHRRAHPDWSLPADVRNLTKAQAARIYRAGYWDPIRGDDLPPAVALLVFDSAVNQGVSRASRLLQEAAGAQVDGKIGPVTVKAARDAAQWTLIREIAVGRALAYVATGNMATFGRGWFRRLFGCVIEAVRIAR